VVDVRHSTTGHAGLMDGVYRRQRHIYDVTRKYYLLGRDDLIDGLAARPGDHVLELGCGTGRNLLKAAARYPQARFLGVDISAQMLETAGKAVAAAGEHDIRLARGDASDFDLRALFGIQAVDRVFISYSLSMIPPWRATIAAALDSLKPGGELHIVDFGQQAGLPSMFGKALHAWLARFHVEPRADLVEAVRAEAAGRGAAVEFRSLYRDYAWLLRVSLPKT
jgi:S-adenosylmethionine-diacylgycerolhomoserine-N-methlytransferase